MHSAVNIYKSFNENISDLLRESRQASGTSVVPTTLQSRPHRFVESIAAGHLGLGSTYNPFNDDLIELLGEWLISVKFANGLTIAVGGVVQCRAISSTAAASSSIS